MNDSNIGYIEIHLAQDNKQFQPVVSPLQKSKSKHCVLPVHKLVMKNRWSLIRRTVDAPHCCERNTSRCASAISFDR